MFAYMCNGCESKGCEPVEVIKASTADNDKNSTKGVDSEASTDYSESNARQQEYIEQLEAELQRYEAGSFERRQQAEKNAAAAERRWMEVHQKEADEAREQEEKRRAQGERLEAMLAQRKVDAFLQSKGYGSDVNARRADGLKFYYPLHDAVKMGDAELVRGLIAAGADPRKRSSSGKTPLQSALRYNLNGSHQEICEALRGAVCL